MKSKAPCLTLGNHIYIMDKSCVSVKILAMISRKTLALILKHTFALMFAYTKYLRKLVQRFVEQ